MTAFELMTPAECEAHIKVSDPTAYIECATQRVYGTYRGLPILLAGNADWKHALYQLGTKTPRRTDFGYYIFD